MGARAIPLHGFFALQAAVAMPQGEVDFVEKIINNLTYQKTRGTGLFMKREFFRIGINI